MGLIQISFLGLAKVKTGKDKVHLAIDDDENIKILKKKLFFHYPQLESLKDALRFSINCEWACDEDTLKHGDEVGVIPPVSGG